jgi:hypothetical protein
MNDDPFAKVHDRATLQAALRNELNHCDCGSDGTIPLLLRLLELAQHRTSAIKSSTEEFRQASEAVEAFLVEQNHPSLTCWFVYLLEHLGFITHGFNLFDIPSPPKVVPYWKPYAAVVPEKQPTAVSLV